MAARYQQLVDLLAESAGLVVAYSGGVDSSLLLAAACDALGNQALAVTARSPLYPQRETALAIELARQLGARHRVIDTDELARPGVAQNPTDRCYHCKHDKFSRLLTIAAQEGLSGVVEGSNHDDLGDYRPGLQAVSELAVRSPLIELGWGKDTIRTLARERGLPNWNKPSAACLASRIPYGQPLSIEVLGRVEAAERALLDAGFVQVRVRDHGPVARIEIDRSEFERLLAEPTRSMLLAALKQVGYTWVGLDLAGYRTGAMNEGLSEAKPTTGDA